LAERTLSTLEDVRKGLRTLVKFIERTKRPNIYTDFVDSMGELTGEIRGQIDRIWDAFWSDGISIRSQ
jgi:hypothetical protein